MGSGESLLLPTLLPWVVLWGKACLRGNHSQPPCSYHLRGFSICSFRQASQHCRVCKSQLEGWLKSFPQIF